MANRFRDPTMRREYDAALWCFRNHHGNLFLPSGARNTGNSMASFFWRGYDGTPCGGGFVDRASKNMIGYAYYRAGQDAAKEAVAVR